MRLSSAAATLALVIVACGGGSPSATFTAGDLTNVQEALALRGVTVRNAVSGDAGCPDSALHSNVVRLDVTVAGDAHEQRVHLFRWRRPAQFAAGAASFADCVTAAAEATAGADAPAQMLEAPPWRAYGFGWSEELRLVLGEALRAVGGG